MLVISHYNVPLAKVLRLWSEFQCQNVTDLLIKVLANESKKKKKTSPNL